MDEFFILGANGQPHQILIYDVIGLSYWTDCVTAKAIVLGLSQVSPTDEIHVRINSRGGNHDDGTAIYNVLANHQGKVTFSIEGYACSMAAVICAAGAPGTVSCYETALVMLHRASGSVWGNVHDMLEAVDSLKAADDSMAKAFARKTGKTPEEILAFLDEKRDTWLTAEQAKEFGLVDVVAVPSKFTALLDKSAVTALAKGEGAAILSQVALPPKIKAALDGVPGAVAVSVDGDKVLPIKAQQEKPAGGDNNTPEGDAAPGPNDAPVPVALSPADALKADRDRVASIMAQAKAAGLGGDEIVQEWIADGVTAEAAGKMILAIKRTSQSANHVQGNSGHDIQTTSAQAIADSWGDAYKSVGKR